MVCGTNFPPSVWNTTGLNSQQSTSRAQPPTHWRCPNIPHLERSLTTRGCVWLFKWGHENVGVSTPRCNRKPEAAPPDAFDPALTWTGKGARQHRCRSAFLCVLPLLSVKRVNESGVQVILLFLVTFQTFYCSAFTVRCSISVGALVEIKRSFWVQCNCAETKDRC